MPPDRLHHLDMEDWSLIAIALAHWAGNPNDLATPAERRAYDLIEAIATAHDCSATTLVTEYRPPDVHFSASDFME